MSEHPRDGRPAQTAPATGRWEPCGSYTPDGAGSPVCVDCGWLHDDHESGAVIHRLPARAPSSRRPRRLAS